MSDRNPSATDADTINRLTQLVALLTEQIDADNRNTATRSYRAARAQCWHDLADRAPETDPFGQASKLAFQQLAAQDMVETSTMFTQGDRFSPFESYVQRNNGYDGEYQVNNDHPLRHDGELPSDGIDGQS